LKDLRLPQPMRQTHPQRGREVRRSGRWKNEIHPGRKGIRYLESRGRGEHFSRPNNTIRKRKRDCTFESGTMPISILGAKVPIGREIEGKSLITKRKIYPPITSSTRKTRREESIKKEDARGRKKGVTKETRPLNKNPSTISTVEQQKGTYDPKHRGEPRIGSRRRRET